MEFEVKALYDFNGETENEISFREGDYLTVLNSEVGEGWWFGRTKAGSEGMFPEAYVERLQSAPGLQGTTTSEPVRQSIGWGLPDVSQPTSNVPAAGTRTSDPTWGDDWNSSDDDSFSSGTPVPAAGPGPVVPSQQPGITKQPSMQQQEKSGGGGGEKKSFSFGKIPFGKSSAFDSYLAGATEATATIKAESIKIGDDGSGYIYWSSSNPSYTCAVGAPRKAAKFGGLKAYMEYPITPSFNNIQVSRRYKHFDWLYVRLQQKFGAVIAIPPLPDKQAVGRFEEETIETRRIELQSFCDRICRHPVLGQSAVWKHFITETDERRWTSGKRKAEADTLIGPAFLTTLQTPEIDLRDDEIIDFGATLDKVENAVKNMFSNSQNQSDRCRGYMKKNVESIAMSFTSLGQATNGQIPPLEKIGDSFMRLTDVYETKSEKCWEPLVHLLHDYRGLVNSWDNILGSFNSARDRQKEMEGLSDKEKFTSRTRINIYRLGLIAERNYFLQEIQADMNSATQTFVIEQINHYRELMTRLEGLHADCWGDVCNLPPPSPLPPTTPATASAAAGGGGGGQLAPVRASTALNAWGDNEGIYEEMP